VSASNAAAADGGDQHGRKRREEELRGAYGGPLLDVTRDGWERLLTHKQPKRARADEYRDRPGEAKKGPLQPAVQTGNRSSQRSAASVFSART
jgi:hypothetical protein